MRFANLILRCRESAEGDGSLLELLSRRETAIESPTMELRLSSEQGCLPSSNPIYARANRMVWNTMRDRERYQRRKEGMEG